MKFTTLAFSAVLISAVFGYEFQIYPSTVSTDATVDNMYLTITYKGDVNERNDISFGEKFGIFYYDIDTKEIYSPGTEKPYAVKDYVGPKTYLTVHNGYLVAGNTPARAELINSDLFIEGNDQFYALDGLIYVFNIAGSSPTKLKAFLSGLSPDPNSVFPSSPTPNPSGYTNTTITTTLTYTEGHTTVVTVTTCPPTVTDCPARHTPQVVTAIIPVTKTTTYCPATTTPTYVPYTSYTEYTAYTPTVAGESTVKTTAPVTEVPNGAAKAGSIAGIGMLAAVAYLF